MSRVINIRVSARSVAGDHLVISQIYGGGGNGGATWRNDYVEIYNPTSQSVDLGAWTIQYAPSTGSSWQEQPLGSVIRPGQYYLVRLGSGGDNGAPLQVEPNIAGAINLSETTGKLALVRSADLLDGACPVTAPAVVDIVGYGTANCFEGSGSAPAPSPTRALFRRDDGNTDTDVNSADFITAAPSHRRTGWTGHGRQRVRRGE